MSYLAANGLQLKDKELRTQLGLGIYLLLQSVQTQHLTCIYLHGRRHKAQTGMVCHGSVYQHGCWCKSAGLGCPAVFSSWPFEVFLTNF